MSDEANKTTEIAGLQQDLNVSGLSRRRFLDRLKALGVGFGAASAVGVSVASARESTDQAVTLKSTNPALDGIVTEGREAARPAGAGEDRIQTAQMFYRRFFYRRGYRRFFYRRYARFFRRYRRFVRFF